MTKVINIIKRYAGMSDTHFNFTSFDVLKGDRNTRDYYKVIWDQLKEIELHDFIYYRHENVKTIKAFGDHDI